MEGKWLLEEAVLSSLLLLQDQEPSLVQGEVLRICRQLQGNQYQRHLVQKLSKESV